MRFPPYTKVHGHIEGVPVGLHFNNREDLAEAGVHGRPGWGIHGTAKDGAYAIVLNEGYEDDDDQGETIVYTGQGKGKQKLGSPLRHTIGHRKHFPTSRHNQFRNGPQVGDQEWTHGNKALQQSYENGLPVRVIRGPDGNVKYCPYEGYRYDGLYRVVQVDEGRGKQGFMVCRFTLRRLEQQDPLPRPYTCGPFWKYIPGLEDEPIPRSEGSASTSWPEKRMLIKEKRNLPHMLIEGKRKLSHMERISRVRSHAPDGPDSTESNVAGDTTV